MLVRYWQPWREVETLRGQLDRMFDDLTHTASAQLPWTPAVELQDTGDNLVVRAQLPGVNAKDLDIQVTREAVSISGEHRAEHKSEENGFYKSEFRYGKFSRMLSLPVAVENSQVKAEFKDGVLSLTLPKVAEVRNRVVKVNLGDTPETQAASDAAMN